MDYEITHKKKAARPCICSGCGRTIGSSEEYYRIETKEEYSFRNIVLCSGCYAVYKGKSSPTRE